MRVLMGLIMARTVPYRAQQAIARQRAHRDRCPIPQLASPARQGNALSAVWL